MGRSPSDAHDRDTQVRRILVVEGAANVVVLGIKLAVGVATGSAAILGDAVHSLADIANNIMAWIAMRLAAAPPDREHPYGHRKFEPLAVFVLATLLSVMAVEIALRSFEHRSRPIAHSDLGLAMMGVVLAANIAISIWESRWARRLDSDVLRADVRHTASDAATTVSVILGWQFAARGYAWLDTAAALGVSALILYLA
jgi:cation diffusion facilitator family transporter